MTSYPRLYKSIVWFTIVAILSVFWFSVYKLSVNFPFYDDFGNIVEFIVAFQESSGVMAKLALLFKQNFEHRVLFSKLVTLAQFYITGQVNIRWLIILGNLSLLGIAWLFYTFYRDKKLSLIAFFGICCLLFQVQHYEDTISWATCSLQHAPCILFTLWSFHFALQRRNLWGSAALSLLALFTSANGLATISIWLLIVWLVFPQRKAALLPTLVVLSITSIHLATLTLHSGSLLGNALSDVFRKLYLLLSFVGLLADPRYFSKVLSMLLGILILVPLCILMLKALRRNFGSISHLQWLSVMGIAALLFVGFLIVFARMPEASYYNLQKDRYKIYSALFAVLAISFYDGYANRIAAGNWIRHALAFGLLVFNIATYYLYYGPIRYYQSGIEANQYNLLWSRQILYPINFIDTVASKYMTRAESGPLHNALPASDSPILDVNWKIVSDTLAVETIQEKGNIRLKQRTFTGDGNGETFFAAILSGGKPKYLMQVDNAYLESVEQFYTTFTRPTAPGFSCLIFKNKMKAGVYDVRLVSIKKGREARVYHLSKITI